MRGLRSRRLGTRDGDELREHVDILLRGAAFAESTAGLDVDGPQRATVVDMIRVLSTEPHDSEITLEALNDLADSLASAGLDAAVGGPEEPRRVRLRKSVEPGPLVDVLLILLGDAREGLVGAVVALVLDWARRHRPRRRNGARPVAVIWGPDGNVLQEVVLSDKDES